VEFQPDCWHNISPAFLEAQITKSLERLKIGSLDVLLLHNPEYFLKANGKRDVYYQRIEKAFQHLETERAKGRIKFYGISSNTFPEDEARSDFTSLTRILEIAGRVGKPHHFAVVQFPFNLFEPGAALAKNNERETVLDLAAKAKLGVLINRPFNSFGRGRLTRLTSFTRHDEVEVKGGLHVTLGRAVELERTAPGYPKAVQGLAWAHLLREKLGDFDDLLAWREALYNQILPSIRQALARLSTDRQTWANDYQNTMQELLKLITWDLENLADQKSKLIEEQINLAAPELVSSASLSQKMIRLYSSFPQVSSVLVGMRTSAYVVDALAADNGLTPVRASETLAKFQRHRS
jgi:aryl-alcohol dehydrogenase-like predicted oxidoreductase